MKRRQFISRALAGAVAGGSVVGCKPSAQSSNDSDCSNEVYKWKMVTSWPKGFPGTGVGADRLAHLIQEMSGGRIQIKLYGAGELVPALEVFDAVSNGVAEMGHSASYYWQGKGAAFNFFSTVPFGLNSAEMDAWLYEGGGIELWQELYRPFGLIPFPAGNTGMQMGGWFNKKINSLDDFKGLKMRIPGLGGQVITELGGVAVTLPGGELFTAMQTGTLDATEWSSPYNDLAMGLYKVAKYYYYPGWHEPGTTLECIVNKKMFEQLPQDLQAIVRGACQAVNMMVAADYLARNNEALASLQERHNVELLAFPNEVLERLHKVSAEVVRKSVEGDDLAQRCYDAYQAFRTQSIVWNKVSEDIYFDIRR